MKDLKGLYSALLIPFDENGEVKEEGLRQVIEHNINVSKVDGLYVNGSSGENFLLNTAQKKQIFKFHLQNSLLSAIIHLLWIFNRKSNSFG